MMIRLENINKSFGEKKVLNNVNMTFPKNKIHTVIAPNGMGKTTLLSIISGTLDPDYGRVIFEENMGNGGVDIVLAGNKNLYMKNTVKENVYYFCVIKGMNKKHIRTAIERNKKYFPIYDDIENVVVEKLSYGQKRMVAIFVAIVSDSSCILLDEITEGLDRGHVDFIKKMLDENKNERTIIMVSHDYDFVIDISDSIYFIHNGNLIDIKQRLNLEEFKKLYDKYYLG